MEQRLARDTKTAVKWAARGRDFHRAGRLKEAAAHYAEALKHDPQLADVIYLLGVILQKEGNQLAAIDAFARATAVNPALGIAHQQRGFALQALQRASEAIQAFRAAITADPRLSEAHHQLGNALAHQGKYAEAAPLLREATRLAPNDPILWLSRGLACFNGENLAEAVESFQQAVKLKPDLAEAREILAQAFLALGRFGEAREQLTEALKLRPAWADANHDLGRVCFEEGRLTEAVAHYRAALAVRFEPATYSNLLLTLQYLPESTPDALIADHRRWAEQVEAPLRPLRQPHKNEKSPHRRLRIGYVSPDLRDHAITRFFWPPLAGHHRRDFEVFCYANTKKSDSVTEQLRRQAYGWREIASMTDDQVAALVRDDAIDILVDLSGHMTNHRLLVFARKPAPIQITWIGYPATTGLQAMDYRLTDAICDPPGQTETWHSEQLVRLPGSFLCFRAPDFCPPVNRLPALEQGCITFGSLNNFRKISLPCIALWAQVLAAVPNSRLFLPFPAPSDSDPGDRLIAEFVRLGIAAKRITLHREVLPNGSFQALYHKIDVGLDPFPYNGTTTTAEALWMGIPVITLVGQTHVARVGASLVTNLGFPDWAVATPADYVAKCRELAADLPRLQTLRSEMRERMRLGPLCDSVQFMGNLESALRGLWEHWCGQ